MGVLYNRSLQVLLRNLGQLVDEAGQLHFRLPVISNGAQDLGPIG
jgi:hypothetical protein